MNRSIFSSEKLHLALLLEVIQRCIYFLEAFSRKLTWPLPKEGVDTRKKDAAIRHACILAGESADSFLSVLSSYEKTGALESVGFWQLCRTAFNPTVNDHDIEYAEIAGPFNSLQTLIPLLYVSAVRFLDYCQETLGIEIKQADFFTKFVLIIKIKQTDDRGVIK